MLLNMPVLSDALTLSVRAVPRAFCQRSKPAPVMPSACITSASDRNCSPMRWDRIVAMFAPCSGRRGMDWFSMVTAIRITPPAIAR